MAVFFICTRFLLWGLASKPLVGFEIRRHNRYWTVKFPTNFAFKVVLYLLPFSKKLTVNLCERTCPSYFYRLLLLQQLKEFSSLKSNEKCWVGYQTIYKFVFRTLFLSLTVFSRNGCQFET